MSERFLVRVTGETALDAINAAKAWLAGEPRWQLRTVASVKRAFGPNGELTSAWVVGRGRRRAGAGDVTYPLLPGAGRIPPLTAAVPPEGALPAGVVVSRPCACGLLVTASRHDPGPGVAAHNATAAHVRWWARARADWQGEER